jgi:hypothetical protein
LRVQRRRKRTKTTFRILDAGQYHAVQSFGRARGDGYTSMFRATSWPLGELLRALKVSRRLTGSRDEPGMFVLRRDEAHRLVGCMVR